MNDRSPTPSDAFSSRVGSEILPVCSCLEYPNGQKQARSEAASCLIGESETERVGRGKQQELEFGGLAEHLPSALRSNRVRRAARPHAPRSGAANPFLPVGPGATHACSPLTRLSPRRRPGQRGRCAARRFAPFGAAPGLACEMRSRMIPEAKEVVPRGSDQSWRASAPRSHGRPHLRCTLVDAAGDPDVYEPITFTLNGSGPSPVHRGAAPPPLWIVLRIFERR